MIGAIVLIDKFGQYVYIFECIGSCEIKIQFRFKGSIKLLDDTGFGISMGRNPLSYVALSSTTLPRLLGKILINQ